MSATIAISTVEIAHLDLAFAHTRIQRPRQIVDLADSLMRCGQLLPIVVVTDSPPGYVLIDGYRRVEAARRAGLDTLTAQIWPGSVRDALCRLLASDSARQLDVFEQAAVLHELKSTHGLNQNRIADRMGRHPSWVARRLALIDQLPEQAVYAVRSGLLSSWSASRAIVPLARANASHARSLVESLSTDPMTSRQLYDFWQHYRKAGRALREKMIAQPVLFLRSLSACRQQSSVDADDPAQRWSMDLRSAVRILVRCEQTACHVFGDQPPACDQLNALDTAASALTRLRQTIGRYAYAKPIGSTSSHRPGPSRPEYPADRAHNENVAQNRPPDFGRPGAATVLPAQSL